MVERLRPALLTFGLLLLAMLLAGYVLSTYVPPLRWWPALAWPDPASMTQVVAANATLPRLAASLLAGAALGLSGGLLQLVLRNPLASPDTIGIAAGAQLALAAASLYAPGLLAVLGRDVIAFAGAATAVAAALGLSWRSGLAAGTVILAGLAASLYAGALGTLLVLMHSRQLAGLFVWSAGSLAQLGWTVPEQLALRLAVAALVSWLLARPLRLLELPDEAAKGIGVPVPLIRLSGLIVAVALGGSVVSLVGVIGFVGLAAPLLVGLAGAGSRGRLAWASVMGSALLALTDQLVQLASGPMATLLPTGAVTALLGAPLLLLLLTFVARPGGVPVAVAGIARRLSRAWPMLLACGAVLLALIVAALLMGNSPRGWEWNPALVSLRAPRVAAAALAGAMLAVAGLMLQRMLGNPAASPDVLGLGTGSIVGLAASLWLGLNGLAARLLFGTAGAATVLGLLLLYARGGAIPQRMLLAGIAAGAAFEALLSLLLASGDPRAETVLTWMSGSTYLVSSPLAWAAAGLTVALLTLAALMTRWLAVLPLGDAVVTALGFEAGRMRLMMLLLVAALTGLATMLVGPLSFVGLMAPHAARLLGLPRAGTQMAAAPLCGAIIMVAADWLGRTVLFPTEIPAGLVTALLGAPVLFYTLSGRAI